MLFAFETFFLHADLFLIQAHKSLFIERELKTMKQADMEGNFFLSLSKNAGISTNIQSV